jgi:hypothetical protein
MSDQNQKHQTLAGEQFDSIVSVVGVLADQADRLFAETRAFQASILRNQTAWFSKVAFAKTISDVIDAQTEHTKAAVGEARKIAQFVTELARSAVSLPSAAATETPPAPIKTVAARPEREAA